MQDFWEKLVAGSEDFIICLLADSSPRVGKEWLLAELFVITDASIAKLLEVQDELAATFASEIVDWVRVEQLEALFHFYRHITNNKLNQTAEIQKLLVHHILIPVSSGVGNTSLAC